MKYTTPQQYYFRLHHPRPRFKTNVEQVPIYLASEINALGRLPIQEFNRGLNLAIKRFPGNASKTQKTIDNWRTEIDALFGLISKEGRFLAPSNRALELAKDQDLVKFFKLFCYHFQYPGGFLKPHRNLEFIIKRINFRPATYLLQMLYEVEKETGKRAGISKAEATHCIFNDLRVTKDGRSAKETWRLILENRENELEYDWSGDVTRYAGDILDYMVNANLLSKKMNNHYYINHNEDIAIQRFLNPTDHFDYYAKLQDTKSITLDDVKELDDEWNKYFNTKRDESFFDTDLLALLSNDEEQYSRVKAVIEDIDKIIEEGLKTTGGIGSVGESLVLSHEINRITKEGRPDLTHLIKLIPTSLAVGYDINSVETDMTKRLIEVKTTASSTPINFNRFHLTPNEWNAAESFGERYHVYRLMVTKGKTRLFVLSDPVGEYKRNNLSASPKNGMDITFDPNKCGYEIELII